MSWDGSGFLGSLRRARAAVEPAAERRMDDAAEALLEVARGASDFPYDTGSLSSSGTTEPAAWEGRVVIATVSFGGDSNGMPNDPVVYAEFVHEGFDLVAWGHATGRHIAGRPYLAQPFVAEGPTKWEEAATGVWEDIAAAWSGQ